MKEQLLFKPVGRPHKYYSIRIFDKGDSVEVATKTNYKAAISLASKIRRGYYRDIIMRYGIHFRICVYNIDDKCKVYDKEVIMSKQILKKRIAAQKLSSELF